jgi:ABC-type Fe3+ transport system permease subunit
MATKQDTPAPTLYPAWQAWLIRLSIVVICLAIFSFFVIGLLIVFGTFFVLLPGMEDMWLDTDLGEPSLSQIWGGVGMILVAGLLSSLLVLAFGAFIYSIFAAIQHCAKECSKDACLNCCALCNKGCRECGSKCNEYEEL